MNISEVSVGQRVHYIPFKGCSEDQKENGIIKTIHPSYQDSTWVVYHCNNDWKNLQDYTAALTKLKDLKLGWVLK